jgi:hypothetical protein
MKLLVLFLLVAAPCLGQRFPGVRLIRPDPGTGRPVSVATPCAEPSEYGDFTWATPISVYEDSGIGLYVDQSCLNTAALGFSPSGKYGVFLYTHYMDSDWPCIRSLPPSPSPEQAAARKEWQTVCKDIVYRVSRLEIDTRAGKYRISNINLLDSHGFHLSSIQSSNDWRTIADLGKDPYARPLKLAIDYTTKLVEKESAYWIEHPNQRQH